MESGFEIGDVVRLKSGGPLMTVSEVFPGYVTCVWFLEGKPIAHDFDPRAVQSASIDEIKKMESWSI